MQFVVQAVLPFDKLWGIGHQISYQTSYQIIANHVPYQAASVALHAAGCVAMSSCVIGTRWARMRPFCH